MAAQPAPEPTLIAGRYAVNFEHPLPEAGGGLPAFVAKDTTGALAPLMALPVNRKLPARAQALLALGSPIEGLLNPLARGTCLSRDGEGVLLVIAQAPPGPAIGSTARAWSEMELLDTVLRPAARTLDKLARKGLTHRAIRPNNVFIVPGGVVLGFAWGAPAAVHQSPVFEPPESAMCLPAGRGDGSIADDVYALGVLLLALAMQRVPLAGITPEEVVRRKLAQGSFEALVGSYRLPQALADLVRGMLAEDPEHRPSPALLSEPWSARARRVAARPPRRAARPLELCGMAVWDTRTLAYAIAKAPEAGLRALRAGLADQWLRRAFGEPALVARLDEVMRARSGERDDARRDALIAMRLVAMLDPLAPLCWRGLAIWPDGLGPALAATEDQEAAAHLCELTEMEVIGLWASFRADRCDVALLRSEARQYRAWLTMTGPAGGLERLMYMLNPLQPCASPLLGRAWVSRVSDLLPALELQAAATRPTQLPIDAHIAAFMAARSDRTTDEEPIISGRATPAAHLAVLARLQVRWQTGPVPAVAAWLAETPGLVGWRSRTRRARATEQLKLMAPAGQLTPMLSLVRNAREHEADAREAREATNELARIEAALAARGEAERALASAARRWGHELATVIGLAVLAASLVIAALG